MIRVENVTLNKRGMKDFLELPFKLYETDKNWCPPLRIERKRFFSGKNPFMEHSSVAFFVAYREGKVVGRVTAHMDEEFDRYYNSRQGFFGFYESIEDGAVTEKLMASVEEWITGRGVESLMGPFNFTTNHEVGFLIKGFDTPPLLLMPYTKPYYPELFYKLGYEKEKELIAYWLADVNRAPEKLERSALKLSKRLGDSIKIRNINMKNLKSDLRVVLDIYNEAWSRNWGFVPMTDREIDETAAELKLFVIPELTFILYKDEKPAAVLVALPDINQVLMKIGDGRLLPSGFLKLLFGRKNIDRMRVTIMGVKEEYRKLGLDSILIHRLYKEREKTSIKDVEMSWILEDNILMNRVFTHLNAEPYKRYIILGKNLPGK